MLDIEWTPHYTTLGDVLCVATSTGSLRFYTLNTDSGSLDFTSEKPISDPEDLVLDLLWHPTRPDVIAVTLSDGTTCVCMGSDTKAPWADHSVTTVEMMADHSLEPWTLAFSPDNALVFSGGDDAVLRCTSLTLPAPDAEEDEHESSSVWSDRKIHQAGVTAILPLTNELLVTGSYDDHIRLISAPAVGRKQVLAELNLGGGVWRLKLLDRDVTAEPGRVFDRYVTLRRR